uniref:stAR-related lipid transfer protein 5-like n=1 Tax=Styela clava TaxID=7725 RepID=UPI00193A3A56|nr:stAR-related lipid transfer protein 5-like [Styela clava]
MAFYELQASKIEAEVMKYHIDTQSWTSMQPRDGMSIAYRKSPHFNGHLYKFECVIDAPDDAIYDVMRPPLIREERLRWDNSVKDFQCIRNISDEMMIGIFITHSAGMGMISSREFLDLYYFKKHIPSDDAEFDRISWILAGNIEVAERPITSKYVRAHNHPTGYAVRRYKNNPNKSNLCLYINVDIGGMIPRSLIERFLPSQQVLYIESVKKEVFRRLGKAG